MTFDILIDGAPHRVDLELAGPSSSGQNWLCRLDGREWRVDAVRTGPDTLSLLLGGRSVEVRREPVPGGSGEMQIAVGSARYGAEIRDPRALRARRARGAGAQGPKRVTAPMPGKVLRLLVAEGAAVELGAALLVIEAMKMQNEIKSPKAGVVRKLAAVEGAAVNAGDVLAIVE